MNWKVKAVIQNFVDMLPASLAHPLYYKMQRNFGAFKTINPLDRLKRSIVILDAIRKHNCDFIDKTFLEIGTGWTLNVPIGLWLCGASKIITVDINPYLKHEIVQESLTWIRENVDKVRYLFRDFMEWEGFKGRLDTLIYFDDDLSSFLQMTNIKYLAPADASHLPVEDGVIDFHYSTDVLEHIHLNTIQSILSEARRILTKSGLLIHFVCPADHFSITNVCDRSISSINFLQFNEKQWNKWSGNRFGYHNRMRAYEYYEVFKKEGIEILSREVCIDKQAIELINSGFQLDHRFTGQAPEDLAVSTLNLAGRFVKKPKKYNANV